MEVKADGAALVALLVEPESRLIAVLMKIRDLQPASSAQPDPRPEERFQNGAVAVVDDGFAIRQSDQLPGSCGGERPRLLARVRGLAGDELGMCRIGHGDWQSDLSRGRGQVFVKGRQRRNSPVDRFGGGVVCEQMLAEGQHILYRDRQ